MTTIEESNYRREVICDHNSITLVMVYQRFLYLALAISTIFLLSQCSDPEETVILDPVDTTCELRIEFVSCENADCDNPVPLADKTIAIYETEEDAVLGNDLRSMITTNEEGVATTNVLPCDLYYLRVDDATYGVYLTEIRLSDNATLHHTIIYVDNYTYDNNDELEAVQNHISLINPRVGQVSKYKYHNSYDSLYFYPDEYYDHILSVTIVEDLGNNRYLVNERFDSLPARLEVYFRRFGSDINNIWEIQEDSIHIVSTDGGETASFVWNIAWFANDFDGYSTSLKSNPSGQVLDFEQSAYSTLGDKILDTSGEVLDFDLFNQQYQNSIYHIQNYTGWDGPFRLRVYSKEDGLIRWLNYFDGGPPASTYGLDLIVQ